MANFTTNYNLIKPLGTETADITQLNNNMDIIDANMKNRHLQTVHKSLENTALNIDLSCIDWAKYIDIQVYFSLNAVSFNSNNYSPNLYFIEKGENDTDLKHFNVNYVTNSGNEEVLVFGKLNFMKNSSLLLLTYDIAVKTNLGHEASPTDSGRLRINPVSKALQVFYGSIDETNGVTTKIPADVSDFEITTYGLLR